MIKLEGFVERGSEEERLAHAIDPTRLPAHIAIIMDGNGRWARARNLPRVAGHRAGIASVREVVETAARLGIRVLTLYAFSVENWKRPRPEVNTLMDLLKEFLNRELATLQKNNIRFQVIGRFEELSTSVQAHLKRGIDATASNTGLLFNIALSYGGRTEIVDACRKMVEEKVSGTARWSEVTESVLESHLYTAGQPDPDLLIRTSGELRISNFLLWQIAYAEIWVTEVLWPDFRRRELLQAIVDFQKRERRYGRVLEEESTRAPAKVGA